MTDSVIIRPVQNEDLCQLARIEAEAHISPWSIGIFESSMGKHSHNYVLERKGELIGYYFTKNIAGELTLENICVAKEAQGQGMASKLMKHLLSLSKQLSAFDILLEVRESNAAAINLYKKYGFHIQGTRKNYYSTPNGSKENAILMNVNQDGLTL